MRDMPGKLHPKTPMTRYVAFLRGVSPLNAKMTDLKRCFQSAGLTEVRSVLASGNLVFSSRINSPSVLQQKADPVHVCALRHRVGCVHNYRPQQGVGAEVV
jgi:Protein of unknown function (DUF1697)